VSCDDVKDLLSAYALDALSHSERLEVEEHLVDCDLHTELAGLRATVSGLSLAAAEMRPPAALGQRIAAAVGGGMTAESPGAQASIPQTAAGDNPRSIDRPGESESPSKDDGLAAYRRLRSRLRVAYSLAAVLAVAVVALIAWNITLQANSDEERESRVHFYKEDDGDWLRVQAVFGEPHAEISLGGFSRLDPGEEYQLWAVRDEQIVSLGSFNTNSDGKWAGEFTFAFQENDSVSVTVEDEGGSDQPTGEPLVRTRFVTPIR
jgi:hypothetical protein